MNAPLSHYYALALQVACQAVNGCTTKSEAAELMQQSIARIAAQVRASKAFIGPDLKLVVVPEYFLTGFPMGESIESWAAKACIEQHGPEYDALAKICVDNRVYLSGNAYELDEHFPGLYFQTSFVVDDQGELVLRYRRLISMFAPTPHDVWDKYLEVYGEESIFPVADTAIGKLAAVASEEILYPEISRALALRGAEILLHSSSEVGSPLPTPKNIAKQARALENLAYVVSANSAGIAGIAIPEASTDSGSKIIDYCGQVKVEAGFGESMVANSEIDLAALRRYRRRPGMGNMLARQRLELFTSTYSRTVHSANSLIDTKSQSVVVPERRHFADTQSVVIQKLIEDGLI